MPKDIARILNKKNWVGDEVGKALIASAVDSYKQLLDGNPNPPPLFSSAQLRKMVDSLPSAEQLQRYNRYVGLNNWLTQYQAVANAYMQLADGRINGFLSTLTTAHAVEEGYRYMETLPAIMTQAQYDALRARRIETLLGEGRSCTLLQLIGLAASRLGRSAPDSLLYQALRERYQAEPVRSPRILSAYNQVAKNGYYQLHDGRRSDEMSAGDWQTAVAERRASTEQERVNTHILGSSYLLAGFTSEEADKKAAGARLLPTWHPYGEPPAGLTKWQILASDQLSAYYPALAIGCDIAESDARAQAEDLQQEFPDLCTFALEEIGNALSRAGIAFSPPPSNKWAKSSFGWQLLYKASLRPFQSYMEADSTLFAENPRARRNGVAILRPAASCPNINESGYYKESGEVSHVSIYCGIEQFTPLNADYESIIHTVKKHRADLEDAYCRMRGYDKAIELIAEYIEMPDFHIFKVNSNMIAQRIFALNAFASTLYQNILQDTCQEQGRKNAKLQALRDYFQPIRCEELETPEGSVQQAKALLHDNMRAFEKQDGRFIGLLTEWRDGKDHPHG